MKSGKDKIEGACNRARVWATFSIDAACEDGASEDL